MGSIGTCGFINAKVRTMRSFLLTESVYRALVSAQTVEEFFSVLSQTRFRGAVEKIKDKTPEEIEEALLLEEIQGIRLIEKNSRGSFRALVSLFLDKYEVEKLKILLRSWYRRKRIAPRILRESIVYDFPVDAIVAASDLDDIVTLLAGTPFQGVLYRAAQEYEEKGSLFSLELALDKDLFHRLWEATESLPKKDRRIARRLLGIEIDLRNIQWIGRFRKYYNMSSAEIGNVLLPYGYRMEEGDYQKLASGGDILKAVGLIRKEAAALQEFSQEESDLNSVERILYHILLLEAKRAFREFPFSIGSILGYIVLLQIETKNLKTLYEAKMYKLSSQQAEDLLVL